MHRTGYRHGRAGRRHAVLVVSTMLTAAGLAAAGDGGGAWTIVDTFEIPESASGLAFDGTSLYCGIYGVDGGRVYQIDRETGAAVLVFTGPHEDAYGLTFDGEHLWTTDHPGSSSTPAVALRLDWNGGVLDQLDLPDHYVSGIAWDGGDFWVSRYHPNPGHIYKLDATGAILDDVACPDDQPWDLAVQDGNLWIADYWGDALYKIDPRTGAVLDSHASEGVDPAGIVWDGTHLWYCDNGANFDVDRLYKVDISGGGTPSIDLPVDAHFFGAVVIGGSATWNMTVESTGSAALEIASIDFDGRDDLSSTATFPVVIPAGESAVVPIVYAPTSFGPLDVTATIHSNDPVEPDEPISLVGNAVFADATLGLAAAAHDFGAVRVGATTRWLLTIQNQGNEVLVIDDVAFDDERFYADPWLELPIEVNPLATVELGVWFAPTSVAAVDATLSISSNDAASPALVALSGSGDDAALPIGTPLWSHLIDTDFDNSPKAMAPIDDVSGDGRADLIVCSEDDFVRCFNGNAHDTADVIWAHELPGGSVFTHRALDVIDDVNGDGHDDVAVGTAWAGRLIRVICGRTGAEIWTRHTDEYGDGGWVYQVDGRYDYDGDGVVDILAAAGDDGDDQGPKRVYCLDGTSGAPIWERPLFGPVFAVIGVADFNDDGVPDVVAGSSNELETMGRASGIDGATGALAWGFFVDGSSIWGLTQIGDVDDDGVPDVAVGDFLLGDVYALDATTGLEEWSTGGLGLLTGLERLDDVNGDGHPDVVPVHSGEFARAISGLDGSTLWTTPVSDNASAAARTEDISGDGVNDLVVGTLFTANSVYFLDGASGAVLESQTTSTPVDAITAIPDVTGDGSWEMVWGGRDGTVRCLSGGLDASFEPADVNGDGVVDVDDLLEVILAWGPNPGHPADIDGDGVVGVDDLIAVILAWS